MNADRFLDRCLRFDLETNESGEIYAIGARWHGGELQFSGRFQLAAALAQLDRAAADCELLLGHNLLHHDLEVLRAAAPGLALLDMAVVDTLYLSPLAFPENPYHRLVKDYKLLRDARNDPLADVSLTEILWREQWQSFASLAEQEPQLPAVYAACFQRPPQRGVAQALLALATPSAPASAAKLFDWLSVMLDGRVCSQALGEQLGVALQLGGASAVANGTPQLPDYWAYALAWLRVAGGNSVLPPWVRARFPACGELLRALRETPCNDPGCRYCAEQHNPKAQLQRWFGFEDFRPQPANADGGSLQQDIVSRAMAAQPLFAILPTGGGKSLCFQVPALARHHRLGVLTVVISPLQALMKDQVDNLCQRTGGSQAGALYGLLSTPERAAVLRGIRLGDLALLYVSPEQLRNPGFQQAISHREIGAWVFDEAHCLSKWGHDFRPDYLYAARFIREFAVTQKAVVPPVQCFTATAKQSVVDEVRDYFSERLDQDLKLFEGGVERDNLHFEVQGVNKAEKLPRLLRLLNERLDSETGCAVVYCATQKGTEEAAEYLAEQGLAAGHFHAGLESGRKREVQDAFMAGQLRVICATNAFGMGIDKDDVRLVIHLEVPGSLENYLQEAGRAGRDRGGAHCVLLYDPQDIETQFSLGAHSRLTQHDIIEILRSLRRMRRDERGEVVLTSAELLRDEQIDVGFDSSDRQADTKVRSAVSWLERAGLIERNQNRTRVFQGRPQVKDLDEARRRIDGLDLSKRQRRRWLSIIEALLQADSDEGFSADELAESGQFAQTQEDIGKRQRESDGQRVLRTLNDMAQAGLIRKSTLLSALLRHKVKDPSQLRLQRSCTLEMALISLLREQAPDAGDGHWQRLSLRHLNQHLLDQGFDSSPTLINQLLHSLAQDGQGLAGQRGSLSLRHDGRDQSRVKLHRDWQALEATAQRRQAVAGVVLAQLQKAIPAGVGANAQLLVEFALEDLVQALRSDALLAAELKDPLAAAERALLFLHEQKVIHLQKGLAVFRQAMTVRILPEAAGRRYSKGDYAPLAYHYGERVFQIHVINEYARLGLERISDALALVLAYFNDPKPRFVKRFFAERKEDISRALSEQAYQRIVAGLSPVQAAVVGAPEEHNLLVLAGPGAGKTRLVVHRCAWLLQVQRVSAHGILLLSFNRSTALELRRRLTELVGDVARRVTIQTYHGLALRLSGHSLAAAAADGSDAPDLDACIEQATALLNGDHTGNAADPAQQALRDQLLQGYRHILVDEYQDIDQRQYELVSAITGRSLQDADARLGILAVGDDDQNVYAFRGSNVGFIRRFEQDYQAQQHHLVENFRSSGHIIACANALIAHNRDRMKHDHPIRIDAGRSDDPAGGYLHQADPLTCGRVQCLRVDDASHQAAAALAELQRLQGINASDHGLHDWRDTAVLARSWVWLQALRALCQAHGIATRLSAEERKLPARHRLREYALLLDALRAAGSQLLSSADLLALIGELRGASADNPWWQELAARVEDWRLITGDTEQPAQTICDYLYEALAGERQQGAQGGPSDGLLLSTAHSVKGCEFDHLLILDGDWTAQSIEEERRLYYVAMTRARHSLCLFELAGAHNPHTRLLRAELPSHQLMRRTAAPASIAPALLQQRFELLSVADLFVDFAAGYPATHPIHRRLAALQPGSRLQLRSDGDRLRLVDDDGHAIAQLSRGEATERWRTRLASINHIRVIAVMRRQRSDVKDPVYQQRVQVEVWELPIVEIDYQAGAAG